MRKIMAASFPYWAIGFEPAACVGGTCSRSIEGCRPL